MRVSRKEIKVMKDYYADFHCHSKNSDGKYEIQEVIDIARKANVKYLALTDHNKLMPDFNAYQEYNLDMVLIQGTEISTSLEFVTTGKRTEIHIVGLFVEPTNEFQTFLKHNRIDNKERLKKMIQNLKGFGIDLGSYEEIQAAYPDRILRRMLLAQVMKDRGFVSSVEEGFDKFIGDYGKRFAWEPSNVEYASMNQTIEAIHRANCLSILAHPLSYALTTLEQKELFMRFKEAGGDAIELFYATYSEEKRRDLKLQIDALGCGYSCGSDFHGVMENEHMNHHFSAELYYQMLRLRKR